MKRNLKRILPLIKDGNKSGNIHLLSQERRLVRLALEMQNTEFDFGHNVKHE